MITIYESFYVVSAPYNILIEYLQDAKASVVIDNECIHQPNYVFDKRHSSLPHKFDTWEEGRLIKEGMNAYNGKNSFWCEFADTDSAFFNEVIAPTVEIIQLVELQCGYRLRFLWWNKNGHCTAADLRTEEPSCMCGSVYDKAYYTFDRNIRYDGKRARFNRCKIDD